MCGGGGYLSNIRTGTFNRLRCCLQDLLHKYDVLEKSHKRLTASELIKQKETKKKHQEAMDKIEELEGIVQVL